MSCTMSALGRGMLFYKARSLAAIIVAQFVAHSSHAESGEIFQLGSLYACVVEESNLAIVGRPQPDGFTNRVVPVADGVGKSFSIYRTFCKFTGPLSLACPGDPTTGTEFLIVQDDANEFSEAFQKTGEGRYRGHGNLAALLIDGPKVTYVRSGIGADENGVDVLVWVDRTRCYLIGDNPIKSK